MFDTLGRQLRFRIVLGAIGAVFGLVFYVGLVVRNAWLGATLPCSTIAAAELQRITDGRIESWRHHTHAAGCRSQALDRDGRELASVAIDVALPCSAAALGGEPLSLEGGLGEVAHRGGIYEMTIPVDGACIAVRVGDGSLSIAPEGVAALARTIGERRSDAAEYARGVR